MARDFLVMPRGQWWYFKLQGERSYHSTGIEVRYNAQGEPTGRSRDEALKFAREEWEKRGVGPAGARQTLREFLEPYYRFGQCPHIARVLADKGRYGEKHAAAQRSRIDRYLITHAIAEKEVPVKGARWHEGQVSPGDVEDWKRDLVDKGVGRRTVNSSVSDLKAALAEGVHRGELAYNPAATVRGVREQSVSFGYFTVEELRQMFANPSAWHHLRPGKDIGMPDHLRFTFALLLFVTGQRPATLRRLQWKHYDGDVLTIPGPLLKQDRPLVVPVVAQARGALQEHFDNRLRVASEDFIFCYDDGGPIGDKWFRGPFSAMMLNLGLPPQDPDGNERKPYSLKHSLITHLLDSGVDPLHVREWVGHSHGHGDGERRLTPVQARYKRRRVDALREAVGPVIESILT